jgi:hypothetical protein
MKLGVKAAVNGRNIEAVSTLANDVSAKKLDNGNSDVETGSGNWSIGVRRAGFFRNGDRCTHP